MKSFFQSFIVALFGLVFFASPVAAHPVPESDFDRLIVAEVHSDLVVIDYQLEIDEFTLLALVADPEYGVYLKTTGKLGRQDIANAFLKRLQSIVPANLRFRWNGRQISLQQLSGEVTFGDSVKFSVRSMTRVVALPVPVSYEVEDRNFPSKPGRLAIQFTAPSPLIFDTRNDLADYRRAGMAGEPTSGKAAIHLLSTGAKPKSQTGAASPHDPPAPPTLIDLIFRAYQEDNIAPLLDYEAGIWFVLLAAFAHGMLHSLSPGHGKTMVAAYLVGERGTARHAVILGVIVTITHTITAFVIALLLRFVLPEAAPRFVQGLLGFFGGLLIAGIGVWLFVVRLSGGHDHVHVGSSHSHGPTPEEFASVSSWRLLLLGISGGMIPCWGAILWVLYCLTANRPGFALWTLIAFSLGLATVLTALGLLVAWGNRRMTNRPALRFIARWLPVVGAAFVAVIGIWICRGSMTLVMPR
ncbi:nickel/cobalt transporter [Zavarzinella formosa]|uniref:nickel/cobalt transporter n=1 Tax=Zavarzinella formosa TaxID=360055 RepID=UPI00031F5203|nr:sulfite exporter TauE/SafE family protein [Zavarzinella formosa]